MNNRSTNCVLDTGAGVSLIDLGSLEFVGLQDKIKERRKDDEGLINASGGEMDIVGVVSIPIVIGNRTVTQEFKVLNSRSHPIILLGRDFMKPFNTVKFDFVKQKVQLGKTQVNCLHVESETKERVRLLSKTVLPARSEVLVRVRCNKTVAMHTVDFSPVPVKGVKGVFVSKARVIPDACGEFIVSVVNVNENEVILHGRSTLGYVHHAAEVVASISEASGDSSIKFVKYGEHLSPNQLAAAQKLVQKFEGMFTENSKKPKQTHLVNHQIITDGALPVKAKYRRVPVAWEDEIESQIQEMLKNGIIRPSASPWNSPTILVKKKDGSTRFVCDFRGLNDVTKKDTYPLPHIRDIIDKMEGARFWSTLDAAGAYWSMPLNEADKEKTAFTVPRGKFEFNVTPYGLSNAGSSYQRMMDMCLSGLPYHRILAYMDDIVIFSRTFEEHLKELETVFEKLSEANITLKSSKCVIASREVDFLGYRLSAEGIKPQERLVSAITEFKRPEKRKEVKSFLGLAGFYRNFIPKFSDIARPLNDLTGDNVKFDWNDACEQAFVKLKDLLSSYPVLAFPRLGEPFVVDVDASDIAFGGVLMQYGIDGLLHPVGYFSDSVKDSQKGWAPTTKEAFALVLAVRHWYVYLSGTEFVLNSDHNPLVYLRSQKDPRGKFSRWILELEEFNYVVKYVRGTENVKADALSRNSGASAVQPSSRFEEKIYAVLDDQHNFRQQLKTEQDADPVISSARDVIANGGRIAAGRLKRVQSQLRVVDGVLTKSGRPVVPASLRNFVTSHLHGVSHGGPDKTYALLKERFFWPNMYAYVQNFAASCATCQQSKCDTHPPKASIVPIAIPEAPMQFISIDIAYMPPDDDGYRYVLLVGDLFSKYIKALPLRDQTAPSIVRAVKNEWIYTHGAPLYLLSDQGSNVDGETMREFCASLGVEKRRSSPFHSQGNGFAERNIRSVREILRSALLQRNVHQKKWRKLLPSLVFALNCSLSKATNCVPYSIVFGRPPTLPVDVLLGCTPSLSDSISPKEYLEEVGVTLKDLWDAASAKLQITQHDMIKRYNKNIRFHDYCVGDSVWLKTDFIKAGENKLAPKRGGPWTVLEKMPNGVTFKIRDDANVTKIVHHDRLKPVRHGYADEPQTLGQPVDEDLSSSDTSSYHSDYSPSSDDSSDSGEEGPVLNRYPLRNRRQRVIPGAIPWNSLPRV